MHVCVCILYTLLSPLIPFPWELYLTCSESEESQLQCNKVMLISLTNYNHLTLMELLQNLSSPDSISISAAMDSLIYMFKKKKNHQLNLLEKKPQLFLILILYPSVLQGELGRVRGEGGGGGDRTATDRGSILRCLQRGHSRGKLSLHRDFCARLRGHSVHGGAYQPGA